MIPYAKLGVAAGCLLVLTLTHGFVYRSGQNAVQVKWEVAKVEHAHALVAQEAAHRTIERESSQAVAALWNSLQAAQEQSQNELETIIADRDAGTIRLRGDLAGCRDKLPSDTTAATGDHGADRGGLSEARQGVVIRIAADADKVAIRLQAAQRYIREVCN